MQPEVSHERAQPLGIDVRVTRGGCDTLMAQERLDIAQVGSALVEQERRGESVKRSGVGASAARHHADRSVGIASVHLPLQTRPGRLDPRLLDALLFELTD